MNHTEFLVLDEYTMCKINKRISRGESSYLAFWGEYILCRMHKRVSGRESCFRNRHSPVSINRYILTRKEFYGDHLFSTMGFFILLWPHLHIELGPKTTSVSGDKRQYTLSHLGPISLTWIDFKPSMDKQSHGQKSVGWKYLSILNFSGCIIGVWELKFENE